LKPHAAFRGKQSSKKTAQPITCFSVNIVTMSIPPRDPLLRRLRSQCPPPGSTCAAPHIRSDDPFVGSYGGVPTSQAYLQPWLSPPPAPPLLASLEHFLQPLTWLPPALRASKNPAACRSVFSFFRGSATARTSPPPGPAPRGAGGRLAPAFATPRRHSQYQWRSGPSAVSRPPPPLRQLYNKGSAILLVAPCRFVSPEKMSLPLRGPTPPVPQSVVECRTCARRLLPPPPCLCVMPWPRVWALSGSTLRAIETLASPGRRLPVYTLWIFLVVEEQCPPFDDAFVWVPPVCGVWFRIGFPPVAPPVFGGSCRPGSSGWKPGGCRRPELRPWKFSPCPRLGAFVLACGPWPDSLSLADSPLWALEDVCRCI